MRAHPQRARAALGVALLTALAGCGPRAVSAPATRRAGSTGAATTAAGPAAGGSTGGTTTSSAAAAAGALPGSAGTTAAAGAGGATGTTAPPSTGGSGGASSAKLQFGLAFGDTLYAKTSQEVGVEFDDAVTVGARWVRVDLLWEDVQPTPTVFDWSRFDAIVQQARARNLSVLPILNTTPVWERRPGCEGEWCSPVDPAAFATFAAAAVTRYAPLGLHAWEIWNEPNISVFWQPAADPAAYLALVRAAAPAMRAADAHATLISGGLAPAPNADGSMTQLDFLSAFARAGGLALVDAVGYHPFSFPVPPAYNAPWNAWNQIAGTPQSVKSILAANSAAGKKLWLTEYGAPTDGLGAVATTDDYNIAHQAHHVDEAYQAELATDAVTASQREPAVAALFWYTDRDDGTSRDTVENFFGLRRFDGTAKPSFAALRAAIARAS